MIYPITKEALRKIEVFNEKATRLFNSTFLKEALKSGFKLKAEKGREVYVTRIGPEGESVDAFFLTYRLFVQNNDEISLHNMAGLYESLLIPEELKEQFRQVRKQLNQFLDSDSIFVINNQKLTNRGIQDTFLYGEYAHITPVLRASYKSWVSNPLTKTMLENELVYITGAVLHTIKSITLLNEEVVKNLK